MMKKLLVALVAATLIAGTVSTPAANPTRGGVMGFIAGCCFGVRAGAAYNDGKEIHWREWVMLVPIAGFVCSIWNGIDGNNGMQTKDYAAKYGAAYY
jgi:hypothetical protein